MVRLRHAAIGRRLREGLSGRFRAANAHFGLDTGRQVENGANQGRESSNYLQNCPGNP